jgi:hypothetical protein
VVDDDALERGLALGSLELDTRLRDALRAHRELELREVYGTSYLCDSVAVRDADIVRLRRHVDRLSSRLAGLGPR